MQYDIMFAEMNPISIRFDDMYECDMEADSREFLPTALVFIVFRFYSDIIQLDNYLGL